MKWFPLFPFVLLLFFAGFSQTLPRHWHESGGFGTDTEAGLGGKVIKVTNLNKDGPGSLWEAVEASGPRLIVFEVGGVINLEDGVMQVRNGEVTIAGETAPSPGISLIRANLRVPGNDVVVSHINVMMGDQVNKDPDCVNLDGENIVYNHSTVYWAKDENFSMSGPNSVTAYKSIIAECLQYAGHPDGEHSKGSLITGPRKLALIGCLYAHNAMRNPRVGGGEILIANGAVYNWAPGWDHRGPTPDPKTRIITEHWFNYAVHAIGTSITFVGNVGMQGPESVGQYFVDGHMNRNAKAYMKDNIIIDTTGKDLHVYNPDNITVLESPPLWSDDLKPMPAEESIYELLRTVGPRPGDRDFHNARVVKTVADGNGELIDSQDEVGGYPDYAETKRPITVPDGLAARRAWLDSLEDEIAVDTKIDLSRLYSLIGSEASDKLKPASNLQDKRKTNAFNSQSLHYHLTGEQLQARFSLSHAGTASLEVFDLLGNSVVQKRSKSLPAGNNNLFVEIGHLRPGVYVRRFSVGDTVQENLFYRLSSANR